MHAGGVPARVGTPSLQRHFLFRTLQPSYHAVITYETVIVRYWRMRFIFLALLACAPMPAARSNQNQHSNTEQSQRSNTEQSQRLDREFQAAVAHYDSGRYAEAAVQLENLLRDAPESFEVHELLGLVYSAQSQDVK